MNLEFKVVRSIFINYLSFVQSALYEAALDISFCKEISLAVVLIAQICYDDLHLAA